MVDITGILAGHSALAMLAGPLDTATQFVFFQTINDFLRTEIDIMQWKLLSSSATIIGFVAVSVLTVWIMFQGFRIVTGQSRQPMMVLVGDSLKATLVVFIATTAAYSSSSVYWTLSDGMSTTIAQYVTGETGSPFQHIDNNLAGMEVAMGTIDAIDTGGDQAAQDAKDRDRWFTGIGIAGPSVIAGSKLDLLEALDVLGEHNPDLVDPVVLRDVNGLDYNEIATLLDVPLGTVKSRIHTARQILRPLLAVRDQ